MEIWKDIKGYEGKYKISSYGRVKSLHYGRVRILKLRKDKDGYYNIDLHISNDVKTFKVHRLVATHFIDNPNNLPQINHKDENKSNNKVNNLEWCSREYNMNYGTRNKRASEKMKGKYEGSKHLKARKIQCITTGKKFSTIKEAIDFYFLNYYTESSITMCCKGKRKSAGKHPITGEKLKWKYIDNK